MKKLVAVLFFVTQISSCTLTKTTAAKSSHNKKNSVKKDAASINTILRIGWIVLQNL